jgi:RNA polymerase sigma-70 factor (ECF subfamily)
MTPVTCLTSNEKQFSQAPPVKPGLQLDEHVLHQARSGDQKAMNTLIGQMQDTWHRFALANVNQSDMAKDVTQETALRVLENIKRYDAKATFKTWSLGIALNVCREFKRKAARQNRRGLLKLVRFDQQEHAPPDQLVQDEHVDLLHRYLSELSDRQREVISLRYFEHCTTQQTAKIMNVSEGTVKATLSQAIAQLRSKWND